MLLVISFNVENRCLGSSGFYFQGYGALSFYVTMEVDDFVDRFLSDGFIRNYYFESKYYFETESSLFSTS